MAGKEISIKGSLKNIRAHAAAQRVKAGLKVAVTGTPIENRLRDLKALMTWRFPVTLGETVNLSSGTNVEKNQGSPNSEDWYVPLR